MFKFLKEKLKGAISKFTKKVEEEGREEKQIESPAKEGHAEKPAEVLEKQHLLEAIGPKPSVKETRQPEPKAEKERLGQEITAKESKKIGATSEEEKPISEKAQKIKIMGQQIFEDKKAAIHEKADEAEAREKLRVYEPETSENQHSEEKAKEKKGLFAKLKERITTTKISEDKFEDMFSELELVLMENNVALEVIEKIKNDLKESLVDNPIKRMKIEETIRNSLKNSVNDLFNVEKIRLIEKLMEKREKPFVIAFFGINGSGKTTTIAKIAEMLGKNNISCVLAAADTFRAASIEQIQVHADALGIKLIKHDYGSDPAAVAFDAIKHAKAKNIGAVLIDTAGRLHTNANLMEELKKVVRVSKPDLKIFVGESIAGNDCIEQVQRYNEIVGIDAIILTKADVDEKGGTAISVSYVTNKPIIYLGVGQEYKDLKEFEPNIIVDGLGL